MDTSKIEKSLETIKKAEKLALKMQPEHGLYVSFSGGKDSQAVLELVKMADVRFSAYYHVTTNDPAENIRFIRQHYPDVTFTVPARSYFQLIETKGLPTRQRRWCCKIFKEKMGAGYTVLTGVRHEESRRRAAYSTTMRWARKVQKRDALDLSTMEANHFQCVGGKDKIMVHPIIDWKTEDVWQFLRDRGLPINPCYSLKGRVGCMYCPFSNEKSIRYYAATHPKQHAAFLHAIDTYLQRRGNSVFKDAEDCFNWWVSHNSVAEYVEKKKQLTLF